MVIPKLDSIINTYEPEEIHDFCMQLIACINTEDNDIEEFYFYIMTPKYLEREIKKVGPKLLRSTFLVNGATMKENFDYVIEEIQKILLSCARETWEETALAINYYLDWEYYDPKIGICEYYKQKVKTNVNTNRGTILKMNTRMKEFFVHHDIISKTIHFISDKSQDVFFPPFQEVYDCIILSKEDVNFQSEEEFLTKLHKMHLDRTGYEACNTEILVNNYIESTQYDLETVIHCAKTILDLWNGLIRKYDSISKFCFIISADIETKLVTMRFHKVRDDEPMWLSEDIESYTEAICYTIS